MNITKVKKLHLYHDGYDRLVEIFYSGERKNKTIVRVVYVKRIWDGSKIEYKKRDITTWFNKYFHALRKNIQFDIVGLRK